MNYSITDRILYHRLLKKSRKCNKLVYCFSKWHNLGLHCCFNECMESGGTQLISIQTAKKLLMNSMKLVILLQSLYWSIHTKDESKRGTAFAFIFGVN